MGGETCFTRKPLWEGRERRRERRRCSGVYWRAPETRGGVGTSFPFFIFF